jgi:hypothetical protein
MSAHFGSRIGAKHPSFRPLASREIARNSGDAPGENTLEGGRAEAGE